MFNADPDWPTQKLLDEIKSKASWAEKNVGYVIQPFSALLVRLSNDAEITANAVNERTQQLIVLTRWLIVLTVIIIFLTVPLVFIECSKYLSDLRHPPLQQYSGQTGESNEQSGTANKPNEALPVRPPVSGATEPPPQAAPTPKNSVISVSGQIPNTQDTWRRARSVRSPPSALLC